MKFFLKYATNIPLQLLFCLIFSLVFGNQLSLSAVTFFVTISTFIKDALMWFLPLLIFSYMAAALGSYAQRGWMLVALALVGMVLSNALCVLTGYGLSALFLDFVIGGKDQLQTLSVGGTINPFWVIPFKPWFAPDTTMLVGAITGLLLGFYPSAPILNFVYKLRDISTLVFKKVFIPVISFYVLGFLLKTAYEDALIPLVKNYTLVFAFTMSALLAYLSLIYLVASKGNMHKAKQKIINMWPAILTGFSTISSAATMPFTITATEKNTSSRNFADFIIPTTVNAHLIGDGIAISITALALIMLSGGKYPDFFTFLTFTMYYCMAKFSCAGVPGGGVIVLVPVFQKYLDMSPALASLLTTIYILQDPILTAANVAGNGGFAIICQRIARKLKII